jgi:hypothetical protein
MQKSIMNVGKCGRFGETITHPRAAHLMLSILLFVPSSVSAQVLGPFTVQLAPFCNVITFTALTQGPMYSIVGYDDNCGGTRRSASGSLFANPSATIGGGLTIVAGGQVSSQITLSIVVSPLSGTWSDNTGNSGTLVFGVVTGTGSPRPTADPQQPRVARTCSNSTTTVGNSSQTIFTLVSATLVAPGPGNLFAIYDGSFYQSGGLTGVAMQVRLGLGLASTTISPDTTRYFVYQRAPGTLFIDVRTEVATGHFQVAAGPNTVNALIRNDVATGAIAVSSFGPKCLTLVYVERGGSGGIP